MTRLLAILAARIIGYAVALAIVGGVLLGACNVLASAGEVGPGDYVPPTLPVFDLGSDTPAPTVTPAPTPRPRPTATPRPAAAAPLDCGGADPADPAIDPAIDCEDAQP